MVFNTVTIKLKDGTECVLCSPCAEDSAQMLDYLRMTSAETEFMVRYPDEITMSDQQEKEFLKNITASPHSLMICAKINGVIAGNAGLNPVSLLDRMRHRATFGISIKKEFWKKGIATAIMTELFKAAAALGYEQIELEVIAENDRAIKLYKKFGFKQYGVRKNAFLYRDGRYADEILMMKML